MIFPIAILPSNCKYFPPGLAGKFAFRAEAAFGAAPGAAVVVARRAEWVVTDPGACPLRAAAEFFLLRFGFWLFGWILLGDERGRAFFQSDCDLSCGSEPRPLASCRALTYRAEPVISRQARTGVPNPKFASRRCGTYDDLAVQIPCPTSTRFGKHHWHHLWHDRDEGARAGLL